MKTKKVLICISLCVFFLQCCTLPDYRSKEISAYGQWGESTSVLIEENFFVPLLNKDTFELYGKNFYASSSQGSLSQESIVIIATLQFASLDDLEDELNQYEVLLPPPITVGSSTYYAIQYSSEDFAEYSNDIIYDGMYFNFEIIAINEEENSLTIVNAHVWDYYQNPKLIDFLQSLDITLI